jgi:hypothetical protein
MSGTAAAVSSTDAVTSPSSGNAAWDYAVPLGQEVCIPRAKCSFRVHAKKS